MVSLFALISSLFFLEETLPSLVAARYLALAASEEDREESAKTLVSYMPGATLIGGFHAASLYFISVPGSLWGFCTGFGRIPVQTFCC